MEQQLTAGLRERQVAEFVENQEVEPGQLVGDAALAAGAGLGFEAIDEVDGGVEATASAGANAVADMATARWVFPLPVPPTSTALR